MRERTSRRSRSEIPAAHLSGSGPRAAPYARALREVLRAYATDAVADEILAQALVAAGLVRVPDRTDELERFIEGPLRQSIADARGEEWSATAVAGIGRMLGFGGEPGEESERWPVVRALSTAPPLSPAQSVIYVLAERAAVATHVRAMLQNRVEIVRARSYEEILRAQSMRAGWQSVVLIDARETGRLPVPSKSVIETLLEGGRIVVWGDTELADEVRARTLHEDRVLSCSGQTRADDVALLAELQLGL